MIDARKALLLAVVAGACASPLDEPTAADEHVVDADPVDDSATDAPLVDDAPLAEAPATEHPPDDVAAIDAWLRGDGYRGWIPQSEARPTGDHGGARIFLNPAIDASLAVGAARHPIGAAAVREIYEPDLETLKGLALMVKVADDPDDAGDNWLWYETFAVAEDGAPTVAERGAPGCVGCHEAGVDLVMRPDPPSPSDG